MINIKTPHSWGFLFVESFSSRFKYNLYQHSSILPINIAKGKKMKKLLFPIFYLLTFLSATTINIPEDYSTIQAGINASVDGDTVLVAQGTYSENLILANEIVLASHAIYDDLESDWLDNENILGTIISGDHNGSCLIIRDGNIEPTIIGFTFQDGIGTSVLEAVCDVQHQKRSGGAILIYKAYPTINYNRFINNGFNTGFGVGGSVAEGGAISHFADDDVEFDEDLMNNSSQNNSSSRDIPEEMNIQNNYFENNSSGDGENFYSHGYEGSIDVSYSVFEDIDCATNSVNDFVLKSRKNEAVYVQNDISGNCIEGNSFYVSVEGSNDNQGTNASPFKTIGHALSLRGNNEIATTIHILEGVYSPSTNGEQFPIVLPDNVHLIGENMYNSIIDAEANEFKESRVIIIEDCENVKVANLTISGGYHTTGGCIGGAGILVGSPEWISNNSNPVLENLIISENHSSKGAGIYVSWESNPEIKNCKIINNSIGLDPNGIPWQPAGAGIALFYSNGSLDNILVKDNICEHDNGYGAGIAIQSSTVTINKTTVTQNINARGYYGFWNNDANYANVRFINSLIHENELYDVVLDSDDESKFFYTAFGTTYGNVQYGEGSFDITANMIVTDEDGFTLPPNSVCIDAGIADIDGDGDDDMEYLNDYFGTAPDMGVFEYLPAATGLQYSIQGSSVTLTWDAIPDAQYYKIERSADSLFIEGVETSYLQDNNYTDDNLEFNTEYFYRVAANIGFWTEYSNVVSVMLENVNIAGANDIPTVYKVHQNHPNPFNPVTTLRYDLPQDAMVNITIYDMMGRVVSNLVSSQQNAGYKSIQWNAANNAGQPISAGLYLYTIQAGEFVHTKKMVLLK